MEAIGAQGMSISEEGLADASSKIDRAEFKVGRLFHR
jgi:hypothetical protein